jgi:hypothetical protein
MILHGMDLDEERARVLESIFGVVALIEQARDVETICDYIDRLYRLKARLVDLRPSTRPEKSGGR